MNARLCNALVCVLLATGIGRTSAQPAGKMLEGQQGSLPPPASFHGAQATVGLCKILLTATPVSFELSEDDGAMVITAHMRSQKQAEELKSLLIGIPFVASSGEPQVQSGSAGTIDITFRGQLVTPPTEVQVPESALPRTELHPLAVVNQAGLDSGVVFERFMPDAPVDIGPYWLTLTQFSVSGTCEQFATLLDRLRPHASSVVPTVNRLVFEPTLRRPFRWSAELHLRSLDLRPNPSYMDSAQSTRN